MWPHGEQAFKKPVKTKSPEAFDPNSKNLRVEDEEPKAKKPAILPSKAPKKQGIRQRPAMVEYDEDAPEKTAGLLVDYVLTSRDPYFSPAKYLSRFMDQHDTLWENDALLRIYLWSLPNDQSVARARKRLKKLNPIFLEDYGPCLRFHRAYVANLIGDKDNLPRLEEALIKCGEAPDPLNDLKGTSTAEFLLIYQAYKGSAEAQQKYLELREVMPFIGEFNTLVSPSDLSIKELRKAAQNIEEKKHP